MKFYFCFSLIEHFSSCKSKENRTTILMKWPMLLNFNSSFRSKFTLYSRSITIKIYSRSLGLHHDYKLSYSSIWARLWARRKPNLRFLVTRFPLTTGLSMHFCLRGRHVNHSRMGPLRTVVTRKTVEGLS